MTPARIQLIGRDNTVPAHMTDAQKEQAEGPWACRQRREYYATMATVFIFAFIIGGILWA